MKTRTVKNFILVLLMVAIILVVTEKLTVYASEDADGSYNSEDYKWTDFRDEWSEEEVLAHQEQAALKDDYNVYYYTIREMVLNDEYDPKILSKKYETMDKYWRFYARLTNDRPFIKAESKQIVEKVGIVDKIWELDSGDVVFTLNDNPKKRFLIMPGYDYFHFRYLTEPGDKVHLLTTTDRVVYEFDNYDLTRGQKVNYLGYINYEHPEDMILEGYFPSKLYQERLDKTDIQPESWLQLMLEYVNVEYEQNNGYASNMRTHIFPEDIPSTDEEFEEYCKANEYLDESLEELLYERNFGDDRNCRQQADGFDYDSVDGFLISTFGEIREIKVNNNGETLFTLRDEPTRWYYMSRYYDPLHLANITKPGDKVYIISTLEKIVYGFNNQTIFNVGTSINTPNFKNKVAYIKDEDNDINSESKESYFIGWGFSVKEFWKRVNELSYEEQQKYEKLNIPKTISSY